MSTKHSKELKGHSKDEIVTKLRELEAQLFQAKMKKETGQLTDTATMWRVRKDIARLKTLQAQKA